MPREGNFPGHFYYTSYQMVIFMTAKKAPAAKPTPVVDELPAVVSKKKAPSKGGKTAVQKEEIQKTKESTENQPESKQASKSAVLSSEGFDDLAGQLLADATSQPARTSPSVESQTKAPIPATAQTSAVDGTELVEEDTQKATVDPDLFDIQENPSSPSGTVVVLKVYGEGCLECSCLVPDVEGGSKRPDCHFSRGNKHCPASSARIEFVGERVVYARKMAKARDSHDTNRFIRLMSELEAKPLPFKNAVLTELGILK